MYVVLLKAGIYSWNIMLPKLPSFVCLVVASRPIVPAPAGKPVVPLCIAIDLPASNLDGIAVASNDFMLVVSLTTSDVTSVCQNPALHVPPVLFE